MHQTRAAMRLPPYSDAVIADDEPLPGAAWRKWLCANAASFLDAAGRIDPELVDAEGWRSALRSYGPLAPMDIPRSHLAAGAGIYARVAETEIRTEVYAGAGAPQPGDDYAAIYRRRVSAIAAIDAAARRKAAAGAKAQARAFLREPWRADAFWPRIREDCPEDMVEALSCDDGETPPVTRRGGQIAARWLRRRERAASIIETVGEAAAALILILGGAWAIGAASMLDSLPMA